MSKPFESLRRRLLEAGIARHNVDRYLAELNDHLADLAPTLERDGMSRRSAEAAALARIGSLDTLAEAMIARPDLRSWTARAPWAAFLLAPLLGLGAIFAASLALIVFIVQQHRADPLAPAVLPSWFEAMRMAITGLDLYGLPVLLGWAIVTVALRQRSAALWPLAGAVVVAVIGGALQLDMVLPTAPGLHGEISVGMGLLPPFAEFGNSLARVIANLALTLPIYLMLRTRDQVFAPGAAKT
jgi:hypothetical protein